MKSILILAAGPLQLPAIRIAKRMGIRTVAIDGDPTAPGLILEDKSYVADITDPKPCLKIALQERVDGVIHICSEVAMPALGRINETMGLAGLDSALVHIATNKAAMRRAFERGGAPSPMSIGAMTEEEAVDAARLINATVIVKPSLNSGSRGITCVVAGSPEAELRAAFHRAVAESREASVVVEQFVEGPEFSIEALVWNGTPHVLTVTDKVTTGIPYFVETGHSQPSRFPKSVLDRVVNSTLLGLKAMGLDWCAVHAEVKMSSEGPVIIEIGGRLGGDFITTELVPRSTGIDMVEAAIRVSLGEEPDLRPRHASRGTAIRYLLPTPGLMKSVSGMEKVMQQPGVKIVELSVHVGEIIPEMTSSLNRVGHVIAEGSDASEAIVRAETASKSIWIETS